MELLYLNIWNSIKKFFCYTLGLRKIVSLFIKPWKKYNNITDIKIDELEKIINDYNIKLILIDMDGTLKYRKIGITKENIKWVKSAKKLVNIVMITNASDKLASKEAKKVDIKYLCHARKPSRKGFIRIIKDMNVNKGNVLFIGDALVADIWGAKRVGISKTILVTDLNVYYDKI